MAAAHASSRPRAELVEHSGKVLYKIWMFAQANRLLLAGPRSSEGLDFDDQIRCMALLESMLGHARELMHFLYAGSANNYVRAVDYLEDRSALPPKWTDYNRDLRQLNNSLAHLTYAREPDLLTWAVAGKLTPALLKFVKAVPEDLVQANFKSIAGHTLLDQSGLGRLTVAPADGSKGPVRGYRVHELFAE
jgi:hypothetical protein